MSEPLRILVVDDDDTYRTLLSGELMRLGHRVLSAADAAQARAILDEDDLDVALVDLRLGQDDGLAVLRHSRSCAPRTEVVMLTGHGTIDSAIEAMRAGAFDYLRKPCQIRELEVVLGKARERQRLVERNSILQEGLSSQDRGEGLIGDSAPMQRIRELVERIGPTDATAMILGETGAGKEVVARLVHARSTRQGRPLVTVDCTSLHDELLHSELFGHEKGAYTGAGQLRHGLFEVADGGTLFLDEVGDLSPTTQTALLRVLETGTFRRVGGTREIRVDVRILAATNRDLPDMIRRGVFRSDLYFRLNTLRIEVPPLRERAGDIPALAEHFLRRASARLGLQRRFTPAALQRLSTYRWPGNVRELLHAVEAALVMCPGERIGPEHLPADLRGPAPATGSGLEPLASVERAHILAVVAAVGGNRNQAAEILGISERTLYRKLREYGEPG